MRTTSRFIIPAFSAVCGILITLEHGLSGIIKRTGSLILTTFIFHLIQPRGVFECISCVWICIKCLETLEASQRHRHDRKWNVIRRQPSHSEFFNTGKTQQLCLSVWFYKAPGCTHVDNLMRYWDPAGEERHNGNTRQYTVWISFTKQRRRPHFTTTNEVLNRVAVGSWSVPQEAEPSGPVFWFVELVSSYIRFPVSICQADDDSCSHIITLHFP